MLKFVVMSDLHLVGPGEVSHGLDTEARMREAVRNVNEQHGDFDFCVLAGDLADHGEIPAYEVLKDVIAELKIPAHITLGNHDHRDRFKEVFGRGHDDENGHIQKVIDAKGYRVILLDSSEPEAHHGVLCAKRLAWLEARLGEATDRPVMIVIHHHANDLHTEVDRIKLGEADDFVQIVKRHPDVRQIIAGHVHFASSGTYQGLPFTTLAGNTYGVSIHIEGMPVPKVRLEGPAQYAVVLADDNGAVVHFHNYIDRHLVMSDRLFKW